MTGWILTAVLVAALGWTAWRLLRLRRQLGELAEAIDRGGPTLAEVGDGGLAGLAERVDKLLQEQSSRRTEARGALDQVQTLLGNLREGVAVTTASGRLLSANPSFCQLVGIQQLEQSMRLDQLIGGPGFMDFLARLKREGEPLRTELELDRGGAGRWLEVSAAKLPDPADREGRFLFVFHDVTRAKKLERMRTEFVANVSHELRTPVTVIKGFAEALVEDASVLGADEKARFLEKIRANAERLEVLLRDLLLLSRLESPESGLAREPLSLRELIVEEAARWEGGCESAGCQVELDLATGQDTVLADPVRLSQVIGNLLENCLRHALGCTQIRVSTRLAEGTAHLVVADNGKGIPEKDLPHVFQRFYRVDKGRARESGGTGLGLAIVKHIVLQHGGTIQAFSEKGQGTRIEITLPLAQGPVSAAAR